MFAQYDYFNSIKADFPEIKSIERISGLSGMEEVLEKIRTVKPPVLLVEDDGNGYLSFTQGNFDHGFHSFSIVDQASLNDSSSRLQVQANCMGIAKKLFLRMMADGQNFGDACYGFDKGRVDYQRIGPLVNNFYGYMFSYVVSDENFSLNG
ncbi:hypothetical protein [Mangrovibacterium sp.]|uniref:hypothetical protein n=1 Tax=Mangrovibacterium sp. TaxID=1961364 RepID=UPI00356A9871